MLSLLTKILGLVALAATIAGCAVTPLPEAADSTADRVEARGLTRPAWPPAEGAQAVPEIPEQLTLAQAVAMAFARNPEIRAQYARLGIGQADLADAARLSNPELSFGWLDRGSGSREERTQGIAASFSELLLLPSRRRLSDAEFRRLQLTIAADLVRLAHSVEAAWYSHVGAVQIVAMRAAVAEVAGTEKELARRFHEAGNIDRLQLDLSIAAAARAEVNLLHARSDAATSRERLAGLLALPVSNAWGTTDRLPLPPEAELPGTELHALAIAGRYDLAAIGEEIAMLEDALGITRRWRLLGDVRVGYSRERESDGETRSGPTLDLAIPLFNQGQGAVARASARLMEAQAQGDALSLAIENEVATAADRLEIARSASERLRKELLPTVASVVARRQERVNFMIDGVQEALRAKQVEYDAWQEYLESVRDYWLAHTALRAAVGGSLPGDEMVRPEAAGVENILPTLMPAEESDRPAQDPPHQHGDEP